MINIQAVKPEHFPIIHNLAHEIWPLTFGEILSKAQIEYMLDMMYSLPSLQQQYDKGHRFLLLYFDKKSVGFASYEVNYTSEDVTKIHKIYILPTMQGKGLGKVLLNEISQIAKIKGNNRLSLNVNRFNKAIFFYENLGFVKTTTEDIDIGNGFLMEDFVMEKPL